MTAPSYMTGTYASGSSVTTGAVTTGTFTIASGTARALIICAAQEDDAATIGNLIPTSIIITGESNEASQVVNWQTDDSFDLVGVLAVIYDANLPANGDYTVTVTWGNEEASPTGKSVQCAMFQNVKQTDPSGSQIDNATAPGSPTTVSTSVTTSTGVTNNLIIGFASHGQTSQNWDAETGYTELGEVNTGGSGIRSVMVYQIDTGGGGDTITYDPSIAFASNRMGALLASWDEYVAAAGSRPQNPFGHVFSGPFGGPIG